MLTSQVETMNVFIFDGGRPMLLKPETVGQFYSGHCYLVFVKQWIRSGQFEELEPRVFFWQGCDAPLLTFPYFRLVIYPKFNKEVMEQLGSPLQVCIPSRFLIVTHQLFYYFLCI